jgi:hypothetical protein
MDRQHNFDDLAKEVVERIRGGERTEISRDFERRGLTADEIMQTLRMAARLMRDQIDADMEMFGAARELMEYRAKGGKEH